MVQLTQRLLLQQKQSPQQVLLSTLLQMPIMRLEQKIKQEMEINPLLELDNELEEEMVQEEEEEKEELTEEEEEKIEEEEIDWDTILNDEDNYRVKMPREKHEEEADRPEAAPVTLMDHLFEQLRLSPLNEEEQEIGEYILWCLDEDGYLSCPLELISENLSEEVERIEKILTVIQDFDPPGIASRNLQECMLIQLYQQEPQDELTIKMIEECFEDFTNKRYEKIAKKLDVDLTEIKRIMKVATSLNPKPGGEYVPEAENYITPDVIVKKEEGHFKIILNDWNVPRLRINRKYKNLLRNKDELGAQAKKYIKQKLESARWLINSIYQRRSTIERVMESILNHQRAFFDIF